MTVTSTCLFIVLSVLLFSFFFLKFQLSTVGYFSTSCLNYLSRSNFRSFPFVVLLSRAQPGLYILVSDLFMSLDGSNKKIVVCAGSSEETLALIRKSLRSVSMSAAEAFEEATPHIFVIFGASVNEY